MLGDVAPFVAAAEMVADDDPLAPGGKSGHDMRADESGPAGDEDHARRPLPAWAPTRAMVPVVLWPARRSASKTRPP